MGKILRKASRPEEPVNPGKGSRSRARNTSKKLTQIYRVIHDILPCAEITNLKQAASLAKSVRSYTRERTDSRRKEQRRVEEVGSVAMIKNVSQLGCVFQDVEPSKSYQCYGKAQNPRDPNGVFNIRKKL